MSTVPICPHCHRPQDPEAGNEPCEECAELRAAFEMEVISAFHLSDEGRVTEAIGVLQAFLDANAARDPRRWLARCTFDLTGQILADHGDHAAAIPYFRRAAAIPGNGPGESFGLSLALARSLADAGQEAEALRLIEEAIRSTDVDPDTLISLLAVEGRIFGQDGQPLPEASVEQLARCVERLGLTLPSSIAAIDPRSAARPVVLHCFLIEATRDYGVMDRTCDDLIAGGRTAEAIEVLSAYVAASPVLLLRELAAQRLAELRDLTAS